jgi:apolipoprotein D and lipocalin family protein
MFFGAKLPDLTTVPDVDLNRYQGTWYEIARLPNRFEKACDSNVTATYTVQPDGQIRVLNQCHRADGSTMRAEGVAKLRDANGPKSRLKVTFFWPFYGDYWIIDLDPNYQWVLVGEPKRDYLWVLARSRQIDPALYQRLMDKARSEHFDVSKILKIKQTN